MQKTGMLKIRYATKLASRSAGGWRWSVGRSAVRSVGLTAVGWLVGSRRRSVGGLVRLSEVGVGRSVDSWLLSVGRRSESVLGSVGCRRRSIGGRRPGGRRGGMFLSS